MNDHAIRIIQITDPHLLTQAHNHSLDPLTVLDAILNHITCLATLPDIIILTSEILLQRRSETMHRLRQTKFPFQWVAHQASTAINVKGTHFIMLNSVSTNHNHGLLGDETLDFLKDDLEDSWASPCIITLWHNPLAIRTLTAPKDMLKDANQFLRIIDKVYNVKAILFGHIHHEFMIERNEVWFLASPAICPVDLQNPDIVFQYRVIDLGEDGEIETSLQKV